jgi:DNA primase
MAITQETIDRINFATDIADVVGDYVHLRRKGKDLTACCPFHDEKTPSFYVVPTKNIFYCFGCGKGGNAITFLMEHESMTYVEALKHLAAKYNIEIKEEVRTDETEQQQADRESIYAVLNFAKEFFKSQLVDTEEGKSIAGAYFKERGLSADTIQSFQLGYSPEAWDALLTAAMKAGFKQEYLEKAGLIIAKDDGKKYDRYRNRVIFPIQNISGRVLGFAGRILTNDKSVAKYINSPETEVYHKSQVLYGLYQAKEAIKKTDLCYLTEGYMDVITLHQGGIKNVVASSGTSLTVEQVKLISRFTRNLTVLYDGDPAGINASLRGIDLILSEGLNVRVVAFPNGDDPDSYLRKVGSADFQQYLSENTKDFIGFKAEVLYRQTKHDPIQRAEMIQSVMESIALVPDPVMRQVFITEAARILELAEDVLATKVNQILFTKARQSKKKYENIADNQALQADESLDRDLDAPNWDKDEGLHGQEMEFVRLLLRYATHSVHEHQKLGEYMLEELELIEFSHPVYNAILSEFKAFIEKKSYPDAMLFINHHDDEVRRIAAGLLTDRYKVSPHWQDKHQYQHIPEEDRLDEVVYSTVLRHKFRFLKHKYATLQNLIHTTQDESDKIAFIQELMAVKESMCTITKILGTVYG